MVPTPLTSFQQIESEWERVLSASPVNTVFLTPQWQEVWWDTFGNGKKMAGFYVEDPHGVAAIASLTRSGETLSFLGNPETVDYNDVMVRPGYESTFFDMFLSSLEQQDWDTVQLDSLVENSPTLTYLPDLARQRGYAVQVQQEDTSSGINLPDTWDEYLAGLSKKDRHELRRKFRRLESLPDWRWYCLTDEDQVSARLDDFFVLMRQSSQEKDKYMTPQREEFFRNITRRMSQMGLLRLFFLEVNQRPAATSLCFDYASSRLLYNSGYDPDQGYYSVGLLLNALCLQDAIDQKIGYFDFLRGSEPYKQHLGGQRRKLYQMVVKRN